MPRRFAPLSLLAALMLTASACATADDPPRVPPGAPAVDLPRFMGTWHVIARVPYFAENGDVASKDVYTLRSNGDIGVRYEFREGFGEDERTFESRATVKDGTGNRDWTTWFFGVIPTKFRILEVADDYSWALIGYPGRDLAWVFSRSPDMTDAQYADLLARMRGHGVAVDKLVRVPQRPEQVGLPGFAAPEKPTPAAAQ